MKRFLKIFAVLLIVIIAVVLFIFRSSSGYRSVYLVPENATLIIECKDPVNAWDKIVHSDAWFHLSKIEALSEINEDIQAYDSLVSSSKVILKLVGQKPVTVSQHPVGNGKYDLLYILELGKLGKAKNPEKFLRSILGNGYEVTSRDFNGHKIIEILNIADQEYYFLSLLEGKIIFAFEPLLIEASIESMEKMAIGRNMKFLKVQSRLRNEGLFALYLNHSQLGKFVGSLSPDARKDFDNYTRYFCYTGLAFDIEQDGMISLSGYSSLKDSIPDAYNIVMEMGPSELASAKVIPKRLASLVKINIDDASEYFNNSVKGNQSYAENIKWVEKRFKIQLDKHLFGWMEDEIVLLQTQPSNLGRNNEFAVIFHASDSAKAARSLQYLWRQIKKNSPAKIKSIQSSGYQIDYIALPGILKMLFGKTLEKIEKPYFTQIGENVILSNHPQTLKNIINDYLSGNTLETSVNYYNFNKQLQKENSALIYFEPPVLFHNLKAFMDDKSWNNINKNKEYITCFPQGAFQTGSEADLMSYSFKLQYKREIENWSIQKYNFNELTQAFNAAQPVFEQSIVTAPEPELETEQKDTVPLLLISDLDAKTFEENYPDSTLKYSVELKNGLKHGEFKAYHPNGETWIKGSFDDDSPSGKWKYYNEDGELLKTDRY